MLNNGIPVLCRFYARVVTELGKWLDADSGDYGDTYSDSVLTAQLAHVPLAPVTRVGRVALDAAFDEAEATHIPPPQLADLLSGALRPGIGPVQTPPKPH